MYKQNLLKSTERSPLVENENLKNCMKIPIFTNKQNKKKPYQIVALRGATEWMGRLDSNITLL